MLAGNVQAFDFLSKIRGLFNISEPEAGKVTESADEAIDRKSKQNRQLYTMVLNSLLLNHETDSEIQTCCPWSLGKWQRGRGIPSHRSSACSRTNRSTKNIVLIPEPKPPWESLNAKLESDSHILFQFPKVSIVSIFYLPFSYLI